MHLLILEKKNEIATLCRYFQVRRLKVFGSAARGSDFDPTHSDVDFLVEFAPEAMQHPLETYFGLLEGLENTLGRRVDLLSTRTIRNPYLQAAVKADRELVYISRQPLG
jgi:predicted nucleotidyltransferase